MGIAASRTNRAAGVSETRARRLVIASPAARQTMAHPFGHRRVGISFQKLLIVLQSVTI